ncbi:MAG: 2-C-methyl-D-erythritol 4-phosphate cytidylyltransferase [Geminicoccaceae bacterium]
MTTAALIVGAGQSTRMGTERPKPYLKLGGQTVMRRSVEAFLREGVIDLVQCVIGSQHERLFEDATTGLTLRRPVPGGRNRQESVSLGLDRLAGEGVTKVLIHDAARPLVSSEVIRRVVDALDRSAAVLPVMPVRDSLKRVVDGQLVGAVDRTEMAVAQTPQGFHFPLIHKLHQDHSGGEFTDDTALVQAAGLPVSIVAGDRRNLKITDPSDLDLARELLPSITVVGQGFDVHALEPGDGMILGGLRLDEGLRMVGHSDADVALHAITDALLGTIGDGDIGALFPPTDAAWKGADSALFLQEACRRVTDRGGSVRHVDLTIIGERPKIGPIRDAMRERIGAIIALSPARISVKATTTERLGFTGRGEGLAAQATATVTLPSDEL